MNRRSLLLLSTTILAGLAPSRLFGQDPARKSRSGTKVARRASDEDLDAAKGDDPEAPAADRDDAPPNLPTEPGFQWRNFAVSKYTGLPHKENKPESSIVDWIFRRTSTAPWHGDKIAVLAAGRSKIRAYQSPKVLDQVAEVVERFVDSTSDYLAIKIQFVIAADTRWRYAVYRRLNLIGSGPQGQQIWALKADDAAMILSQLQINQSARMLAKREFEMINGQTLSMSSLEPRPYTAGLQRDGAAAQGFQPKTEELEEGVSLRFSPLLTYDGDKLDAVIELTTNNVRNFHQTRILAPREVGPGEARIDVPEVSETRINQTVRDWSLGQTLVISTGIQPGINQSKGGLFNLRIPGTTPTSNELLVFIDVAAAEEPAAVPKRQADRSRTRR